MRIDVRNAILITSMQAACLSGKPRIADSWAVKKSHCTDIHYELATCHRNLHKWLMVHLIWGWGISMPPHLVETCPRASPKVNQLISIGAITTVEKNHVKFYSLAEDIKIDVLL